MKRTASTVLTLVITLICVQTVAAKDTWTSVRSKNFHLVGNASEKDIRKVAVRLEQFREVFTKLFAAAKFDSPVPTTVVVFKNDGAYKPFKPVVDGKPSEVAGYFQPGDDVNYITLTPPRGASENPFETIYHEYVHLLVANTLGRGAVPPWFNEGLAEYYSTFEIEDDRKVHLGNLIQNHIYLLRQNGLVPLKTLFEMDYYSLHRNKRDAKGVFYAQSWALVHYLILGNDGKRLPQVNRFLSLLASRKPTEAAFREAFETDFAAMEKELKKYVQSTTFRAQVATFERKLEFDAEMRSASLTEAEADAYLGDLLLHTDRLDDAAARLQKALDADPKLGMAHASLGMVRMHQRRFDEAKTHLREAVASNAENYLAHYYYAYTLSREGMDGTGRVMAYAPETTRQMRASLERAMTLKPDFPESYHLMAFVNLVVGEQIDEGIKLIARARALSPGNTSYAFVLAQLHLKKEDFEAAYRTIEPLTRDDADPSTRDGAINLMSSIRAYQRQLAEHRAASEAAGSLAGANEPGGPPRLARRDDEREAEESPEAIEARVAAAFNESIQSVLRRPLAGETRVQGRLLRIECAQKSLTFVVRAGESTLRLTSANFDDLHILAFTPEAGGELTCGPVRNEPPVVVTFRPPPDKRAKTDGALAALEFVPAKFQLKP